MLASDCIGQPNCANGAADASDPTPYLDSDAAAPPALCRTAEPSRVRSEVYVNQIKCKIFNIADALLLH